MYYMNVLATGLTNSFQNSGTIQTCDRQPRKENIYEKYVFLNTKHMQQIRLCSKMRLLRGEKKKKRKKTQKPFSSSSVYNFCYKYYRVWEGGRMGVRNFGDLHLHKSWSRPAQTCP